MKFPEILAIRSEPVVSVYNDKDTILYALGIGMGADPFLAEELPFVYEKALRVVPTMSAILSTGVGQILVGGEINRMLLVHGEQRLRVHKPLPSHGRIATSARCLSVMDKGERKGAVLNIECTVADASDGDLYSTSIMSLFCRGDGGFGGPVENTLVSHTVPARPFDKEVVLKTRPDQALLYRLNGDHNPLHVDPTLAVAAGFAKPILHGLCTYGIACRAVLQTYCDFDPSKIKSFDARFSAPVYPGETIVTRLWKEGSVVTFQCSVAERSVTVLDNGCCDLGE